MTSSPCCGVFSPQCPPLISDALDTLYEPNQCRLLGQFLGYAIIIIVVWCFVLSFSLACSSCLVFYFPFLSDLFSLLLFSLLFHNFDLLSLSRAYVCVEIGTTCIPGIYLYIHAHVSLFWVASGAAGLSGASSATYVCMYTSMDLAHRRLTPDFTFLYSSVGGMNYCVSYDI